MQAGGPVQETGPRTVCPVCDAQVAPGQQRCKRCGARWGTPQDHATREGERSVAFGIIVLVVVAIVAVTVVVVVLHIGSTLPATWDSDVAPIATQVETMRNHPFKHPVPVEYLKAKDFDAKIAVSPDVVESQRQQIAVSTQRLRALHVLGAGVSLDRLVPRVHAPQTNAYYDLSTKRIYVRGAAPLNLTQRVDLAHELTYVLQDQYFDLLALERKAVGSKTGSLAALMAVMNGDANRIADAYLASAASPDAAATEQAQDQIHLNRLSRVPDVTGTMFSPAATNAAAVFGQDVVDLVAEEGTNTAVDAALSGPTPSTGIFFNPFRASDTAALPPPALAATEKKVANFSNNDESFDPFTMYLMLGQVVDPSLAFKATDAYASGSIVYFTRGNDAKTTCFRANVTGVNPKATALLGLTLRAWAQGNKGTVHLSNGVVTVQGCTPGTAPQDQLRTSILIAGGRLFLTKLAIPSQHSADVAFCVARVAIQEPEVLRFFETAAADADPVAASVALNRVNPAPCQRNPKYGLP